jgi:hypothetical protein
MFKFAPGEKATIASLKALCLDFLAKMPLVVPVPMATSTCKSASMKVIVPVSLNQKVVSAGPASVTVEDNQTTKKVNVDNKICGIETSVNNWCSVKVYFTGPRFTYT